MRINRYLAQHTDLSRRKADQLIADGNVVVNRVPAHPGLDVTDKDFVVVNGKRVLPVQQKTITVVVNKPVGYVCSKDGQGSRTVYDLLPKHQQGLNIAGRLDKDSSGLVVLTNDGTLLNKLTHPSYNKEKVYLVELDSPLNSDDLKRLAAGINIGDDRLSNLHVTPEAKGFNRYRVTMTEGRNRQIRRTFQALRKDITKLHRIQLGKYKL